MSKTILVVDDDNDTSYLLNFLLTQQGYNVKIAKDGQEALAHIAAAPPHLVLMGVEMPEMDGLETLRQVRANPATAQLPVVMLTGRKNLTDVSKGNEAGADFYLSKPFLPQDIVRFISEVLTAPPESQV